jgi:hypothetical protein
MAGILDDTNFILFGPASVGIVDLFRVQTLLGHTNTAAEYKQCNEEDELDQHSPEKMAVDPVGQSSSKDSLDPETARHDQDHFDFVLESQLDHLNTQNSFEGFSPLSPISPIRHKASQSPPMVQSNIYEDNCDGNLATDVQHDAHHYQSSRIDMLDNSNLENQRVNISSLIDNLAPINNFIEDEHGLMSTSYHDNAPLSQHSSPSSSLSSLTSLSPDSSSSVLAASPVASAQKQSSKQRSDTVRDASRRIDDSFLNSSDLSICFIDSCKLSENHQQSTTKLNNAEPMQLTNQWKLPLQVVKDDNNTGRERNRRHRMKQRTLCASHCSSHAEHTSRSHGTDASSDATGAQLDSEGEGGGEGDTHFDHADDATVAMELEERLDNFNAVMVRLMMVIYLLRGCSRWSILITVLCKLFFSLQ